MANDSPVKSEFDISVNIFAILLRFSARSRDKQLFLLWPHATVLLSVSLSLIKTDFQMTNDVRMNVGQGISYRCSNYIIEIVQSFSCSVIPYGKIQKKTDALISLFRFASNHNTAVKDYF